ncbi:MULTISPECIES: hypothetical protein [Acinetobacter]|jgi:seryl-tRNA synthetase|uniref:hypothetical protein n=1 Tax=Acinetobacter TaxID=469 RepID=UPI00073D57B1|nr:hypothetical protein [Acinetobacter johnsonii]ALV74962.1 hypothetical protein RZ95_19200 [Acinetobacter johnsonii XBB1]
MKNLLILGTIFLITACSQSETDKLISDQKKLEKQIIELNKQAEPLGDECNKLVAEYKDALAKNSPDTEAKKEAGKKVCQQAFDLSNKALELQGEIVNMQLAIIAEDTKGKK